MRPHLDFLYFLIFQNFNYFGIFSQTCVVTCQLYIFLLISIVVGSIGLLLAKEVRGVVGIESVTSAVEDAKLNAVQNNITNASFIPGAVEEVSVLWF